jgi:hypothetical protein
MPTVGYSTNGTKNSQHWMRALPVESEITAVAERYLGESDRDFCDQTRREEISQIRCIMLRNTNFMTNDLKNEYRDSYRDVYCHFKCSC